MSKSKKIISIIVAIAVILLIVEVRLLSPQTQPGTELSKTGGQQTIADQNTPLSRRGESGSRRTSDVNSTGQMQRVPDANSLKRPGDVNALNRSIVSRGLLQFNDVNGLDRSIASRGLPRTSDANAPDISFVSRGSRRSGPLGEREQAAPPEERVQKAPEAAGDPNDPIVSVQINNMEMKNIITKLMEWTGKSIIPSKEAMNARITVFAPDKLPRSKALQLMYSALKIQGFIVEQYDKDTLTIKQISEAAKLTRVPIIDSNTPLASIQNKEEIVQKFFKLKNYKPSQMGQVLIPMLGEYGNLSSDDDTRILGVIDTVRTLMRIESVIQQFDIAATEPMVEEIFEIHYRNPSDIIQLLQVLISEQGTAGAGLKNIRGSGSGGSGDRPPEQDPAAIAARRGGGDRPPDQGPATAGARRGGGSSTPTSVTIGTGRTPPTLIAEPRNSWVIAKATEKDMELIRKWISKLDTPATIIDPETPLTSIDNKNLVAQRFFKLENYSPTLMIQIVKPILNNTAYISAEESTKTLLVMDTVESLIRAERIIQTFDVPGTEQAVPQIFNLTYADPAEVVQLITMLLNQDTSGSKSGTGSVSISLSGSSYRISSSGGGSPSGSFLPSTSSSIIGGSKIPVVLIPYQDRRQIIARAPAEAMKQIEEWIERLDQKENVGSEYDVVIPKYADVTEVAQRINTMLTQMPGQGIQKSVLIQPLVKAGQIMIFGKPELRDMIKKLILEVDIPPGIFETRYFQLKHADPDLIKTKIDELYSATYTGSSSGASTTRYQIYEYYTSSSGSGITSNMTKDSVRVISDSTLRQVTVIASAENMAKVEKQIEEWDVPMDVESLKPRLIELKNVDPVQMAQLLATLFSEESDAGVAYTRYYSSDDMETKKKIVGPLYGKLTFEYIPGTKKIIVISKIPEAYDIVEQLVREIDSEEMAEVPTVVTLKFADPEKLCEILNATFSEPGASVQILRSDTELGKYSMEAESTSTTTETKPDGYTPWWGSSVTRNAADNERPISNVIGKIRFVPETRTKSILVLSPPEFVRNIKALIESLDVPSKQVMLKAVIVEIDHQNLSSLGVQLATNPASFGSLEENSILALNTLEQLDRHGSAIWGAAGNQGTVVTNTLGAEVYGLIDFLEKKVNAKILNQQTLWTQDNEEASFFKGDRVAFYTSATTSATAGNVQNTEFQRVGMNVAVRPSITPNKEVDLNINIIISQLTTDVKNSQPVRTEMETKTKMVVSDGQTLMLGGILFQQDSITKRGIPGLSDIPILGGLFSHKEKALVNNELIVFITPYVYDVDETTGQVSPGIQKQIDAPLEKLDNVREELNRDVNNMGLVK